MCVCMCVCVGGGGGGGREGEGETVCAKRAQIFADAHFQLTTPITASFRAIGTAVHNYYLN